jgi:hypothetical protein
MKATFLSNVDSMWALSHTMKITIAMACGWVESSLPVLRDRDLVFKTQMNRTWAKMHFLLVS